MTHLAQSDSLVHLPCHTCFKQHAFLVDQLGVSNDFRFVKLPGFSNRQGGKNRQKRPIWEAQFLNWAPPIRQVGHKEAHSEFGRGQKVPEQARHLLFDVPRL